MSPGPSRAAPEPAGDHWARPSRRARVLAAALAIALAALTALLVDLLWKPMAMATARAKAPPVSAAVEVQLIAPRAASASASGH